MAYNPVLASIPKRNGPLPSRMKRQARRFAFDEPTD